MILPHVPSALIDYLASAHPLRNPTTSQSDRDIWIEVGKQELIEGLRTIYKAQQEAGDDTEGLPNVFPVSAGSPAGDAAADPGPGSSGSTAARTPGSAGNRLGS